MKDLNYLSAIERRYLAAHPDRVEWIADLPPEEYAAILREWLTTEEGQQLSRAVDSEGTQQGAPDEQR